MTPYELPPGFLKAREKYRLPDPFQTAEAIWGALRAWRKGESTALWPQPENFGAELMHAIKSDDREFIEALQKVLVPGDQPLPERITVAQAVVEAFNTLFDPEQIETVKTNWPTKKDVKAVAVQILKEAGCPIPNIRQWSRVFQMTGLFELEKALRKGVADLPTLVYYARVENGDQTLYKIGATTAIERRFNSSGCEVTILKTWKFKNGAEAYKYEKSVLRNYAWDLYQGKQVLFTGGNTELFKRDILGLDKNM